MKVGDLVRPNLKCAGLPGDTRCNIAIIINDHSIAGHLEPANRSFEILCKCGSSWQYSGHLDAINESR